MLQKYDDRVERKIKYYFAEAELLPRCDEQIQAFKDIHKIFQYVNPKKDVIFFAPIEMWNILAKQIIINANKLNKKLNPDEYRDVIYKGVNGANLYTVYVSDDNPVYSYDDLMRPELLFIYMEEGYVSEPRRRVALDDIIKQRRALGFNTICFYKGTKADLCRGFLEKDAGSVYEGKILNDIPFFHQIFKVITVDGKYKINKDDDLKKSVKYANKFILDNYEPLKS